MANFFKPAYYQAADNTNYEKCDEKNRHKGVTGLVCRAGGDYDCVGAHRSHKETAELAQVGVKTLRITPASPWKNGYNESCNGSLRDELLNGEILYSLAVAKVLIEASQRHYNTVGLPRQPRLPTARPGSGFFTLATDAGQLTRADALFLYQLQLGKFPEGTIPLAEDRELSAVLAKWLATDCLRVRFGTSSMLSLAPTWAMPAPIGSPTQHVPGWPSRSTAGVGGITMFGGRRWQAAGMV